MSKNHSILFTLWASLSATTQQVGKADVYPPEIFGGIPHLPRCQGLAVVYYGFALGRLESGAPSTFAQLASYNVIYSESLFMP